MLFGSLVELHIWLHSCLCFSLLWKTVFKAISTAPRHLSSPGFSIEIFSWFLLQSQHLSTTRWIDQEISCLLDSFLTPLDRSRSSYMHCFSHVLHLSFILSSITSCFITFMHFYGFFVATWSSLIIFMSLRWSFLASCTLCQSWQKGREIVETLWFLFLRFYMLGGEIHVSVKGRCVSSC